MQFLKRKEAKNLKNDFGNRLSKGFTFAEMVVSVAITALLLMMVYKFQIEATYHMQSGVSNLESLDEARLAISYLRRDFSTACPFLSVVSDTDSKDPECEFAAKNLIRKMVFYQDVGALVSKEIQPGMDISKGQSFPILFSREDSNQVSFFHFNFSSSKNDLSSNVELVEYVFNTKQKILTRKVGTRKIEFKGMESVEFKFFTPQWATETVMLRVNMAVRSGPEHLKKKGLGSFVRISTTLNSHFVSSNLCDPFWNFEAYQKKL
jgi:prepilin-type N-terminal cleavage/methylation domain-containing protein